MIFAKPRKYRRCILTCIALLSALTLLLVVYHTTGNHTPKGHTFELLSGRQKLSIRSDVSIQDAPKGLPTAAQAGIDSGLNSGNDLVEADSLMHGTQLESPPYVVRTNSRKVPDKEDALSRTPDVSTEYLSALWAYCVSTGTQWAAAAKRDALLPGEETVIPATKNPENYGYRLLSPYFEGLPEHLGRLAIWKQWPNGPSSEKDHPWVNILWDHRPSPGRPVRAPPDTDPLVKNSPSQYMSSDARFSTAYNPANMVIVSKQVHEGTRLYWTHDRHAKTGPIYLQERPDPPGSQDLYQKGRRQRPQTAPLAHASDVWFLDWRTICAQQSLPISGLRYVVVSAVEDMDTMRIIREILERDPGARQKNVAVFDSTQSIPILGTPTGVNVVRLLAQRKEYFGRHRFVVSTSIWYTQIDSAQAMTVLFTIDEPDGELLGSQKRQISSQNNDLRADGEKLWPNVDTSIPDTQPRPDQFLDKLDTDFAVPEGENYVQWCIVAARDLVPLLQLTDRELPGQYRSMISEQMVPERYGYKVASSKFASLSLPQLSEALRWLSSKLSEKPDTGSQDRLPWTVKTWTHSRSTQKPPRVSLGGGQGVYPLSNARFQTAYNPDEGIMIVGDMREPTKNLDRPLDTNKGDWIGRKVEPGSQFEDLREEDKVPFRYPSDVWYHDLRSMTNNMEHISAILIPVVNARTLNIVLWATGRASLAEIDPWPGHVFQADADMEVYHNRAEGSAFLGDSYGRDVLKFLFQHKRALGDDREVAAVRVWQSLVDGREVVSMMFTFSYADGSSPIILHNDES